MKKILVPTDFSSCAKTAEEKAIELAKKSGAEIHFLHALFTPVDWVKISLKRENLFPEVKAKIGTARYELNKLVSLAEKQGVKAKEFLVFDQGREAIDLHIKNFNHDFVVMGSHGTKGVKSILGSNTQKVIRYSAAPVLVVKKKTNKKGIKNIVFASSFDEDVMKAFKQVTTFAGYYDAIIHLVFINSPYHFKESDETDEEMNDFIKKSGYKKCHKHIYNAVNEERGILKFSKTIHADMIALVTHGRTGFSRFVSPSLAEDIANHSEVPVLSINTIAK